MSLYGRLFDVGQLVAGIRVIVVNVGVVSVERRFNVARVVENFQDYCNLCCRMGPSQGLVVSHFVLSRFYVHAVFAFGYFRNTRV